MSHDHLDYHKDYNEYFKSKLYLFERLLKKNSNIITDIEIPEYKKIKKIASKRRLRINTILNKNSNLNLISHKYLEDKQLCEVL